MSTCNPCNDIHKIDLCCAGGPVFVQNHPKVGDGYCNLILHFRSFTNSENIWQRKLNFYQRKLPAISNVTAGGLCTIRSLRVPHMMFEMYMIATGAYVMISSISHHGDILSKDYDPLFCVSFLFCLKK